jgi:hypothetical protein
MPEFLSVEAYSHYPGETLSPFIGDSRQLLENFGYAGKDVEAWLTQIAWEPDGSGFGSSLEPPAALEKVVVNGHTLFAKPIINGWAQESIPQLQEAWVNLTLAFETQTRRQNLDIVNSFSANYAQDHQYQPGVGKAVWSIMRRCTAIFPQTLVYFTNEAQTGESWNALLTGQEGIWEFEAALIPHSLVARFIPISDQFAHIYLPEEVGFARTTCWSVLPWEE